MKNNIVKILKKDGIGIIPTDTLYGIVGSAFSKKAVERIFEVKNRPKESAVITLISNIKDLEKFGVSFDNKILNKFWPGKFSIILKYKNKAYQKKFSYISRGKDEMSFRLPNKKSLIEILKKTGPLVAPSANPSGLIPASNIKEAKDYFGNKVDFYVSGGTLKSEPSTLIKIGKNGEIEVLRGKLKSNGK